MRDKLLRALGPTGYCVLVSPAISVPKENYDMQEKHGWMILFFFNFLIKSNFHCRALLASKHLYRGENKAIIRWPPRRVTAFQVVRTSYLGPRPRFFHHPPPPSPPTTTPAMTFHSARSIHSAILIHIIYISGCYIIFRAQKVHAAPILILERGRRKKKNGGRT